MIENRLQAYKLRSNLHAYTAITDICDFLGVSRSELLATLPKQLLDSLIIEYDLQSKTSADNIVVRAQPYRELLQLAIQTAIPSLADLSTRGNILIHIPPDVSKLVRIFDTVSQGHTDFIPLGEVIESTNAEIAITTRQFFRVMNANSNLVRPATTYEVVIRTAEIETFNVRHLQVPSILTRHLDQAKTVIEYITKVNELTGRNPAGFITDVIANSAVHIKRAAEDTVNAIFDAVMTEVSPDNPEEIEVVTHITVDDEPEAPPVERLSDSELLDLLMIDDDELEGVDESSEYPPPPPPRRTLTQADCDAFFASRRRE